MQPNDKKPPHTAVSRIKNRIFQGWSSRDRPADGAEPTPPTRPTLPIVAPQRAVGFPSRIAEFLLVFRLRARRRSALTADILERAVRVVLVTCKHWFTGADKDSAHKRDQGR